MTTREVPAIDLQLTPSPGASLALTGQVLDWNKTNHVSVSVNGEEHQVELTVARISDSEELNVKVAYWHNGKVVIPEQASVVPVATERTFQAEQKPAKLSLSVKPKQVPTRKKLEVDTSSLDPLAGL